MPKWELSFTGKNKFKKSNKYVLEIIDFTFEGRYYKPSNILEFQIVDEEGFTTVRNDTISVIACSETYEDAICDAVIDIIDSMDHLLNTPDEKLGGKFLECKKIYKTWEVRGIDQQAQ